MRRIEISFVLREPGESIIREHDLLEIPHDNWLEVGCLSVEGITHESYRDTLNYIITMVRKIAKDKEIYAVCAAHHGRAYTKAGFKHLGTVSYRTEDDWVMKLGGDEDFSNSRQENP